MINVLFKKLNNARFRLFLRMTALILLVAIYMAMPVYAWFYQGRSVLAVSLIDDPTSIHIDAANADEIRFLNLSSIDVEKDPSKNYTDRVFTVSGDNVQAYALQLAYTTNNQFDYEIYPAQLYTTDSNSDGKVDSSDVPAGAVSAVEYMTHPSDNSYDQVEKNQVYFVPAGTDPLQGSYLNMKTVTANNITEKLAYTVSVDNNVDDSPYNDYHILTYGDGVNDDVDLGYRIVHKYAEPIYWKSNNDPWHPEINRNAIVPDNSETFTHFYVLRVIWNEGAVNNKETDIIYISARNVSE